MGEPFPVTRMPEEDLSHLHLDQANEIDEVFDMQDADEWLDSMIDIDNE